jgi:hypothetical protein
MSVPRLLLCAGSFALLAACADGDSPSEPEGLPDPGPGPHFGVVPVPIETLGRITALGFNNSILPTDHTYWETCESWLFMRLDRPCVREKQPLQSPGSGVVVQLDASVDGSLTIEGPPGLLWGFGHVTPAAGLAHGDSVREGEVVATMTYEHGFDFGVTNFGVQHDYIVPEHYSDQFKHGQHPIALFPPQIRSQLLAVMNPAGPDLGRLSYDSLGTASGTWVVEGTGPIYLTRDTDPLQLWFGRWTERQETRIVTFGTVWPGMENFLVASDDAAPAWEDITASSGAVAVKLWNLNAEARPNLDWPAGTLLLELIDDHSLRMEWFDSHEPVAGFTSAARLYER